jgi:hypothetical protein
MDAPSSGGGADAEEQAAKTRAISNAKSGKGREALSFMTASALLC